MSPDAKGQPMTAAEVLAELKKLGNPTIKKILMNHSAKEPLFGVKVEDMKKIQKRVKVDHALALELFDSGVGDAQYLAGLIADPPQMTKAQLQKWVKNATWGMVGEYTIPWVASESRFGAELAREWIDSAKEDITASGWSTFASLAMLKPDSELDLVEMEKLLMRVQKEIHTAPNRVRYVMNGFVIAVGSAVVPLAAKAKAVAKAVGKVSVDMGGTACKVPDAAEYIAKIEKAGRAGRKRKSARC
jgi:3-methyladenine DNA glycosylase AlkD